MPATRPICGAASSVRCSTPSAVRTAVGFVREVAELSAAGASLPLDADLAARYGKTSNTAFAGIVAGPNKVMRRVARRDLISWDADVRGYRMEPADAEIILQRWPAL